MGAIVALHQEKCGRTQQLSYVSLNALRANGLGIAPRIEGDLAGNGC
jgi:hypothetical protein